MIHLLQPPQKLMWTDQYHDGLIGTTDPNDVEDLEWQEDSEMRLNPVVLEVAYRRGIRTSRGLLLTSETMALLKNLRHEFEVFRRVSTGQDPSGNWELDGRTFAGITENRTAELYDELKSIMAEERDPTTVRFWEKIGGVSSAELRR